MTEPSPLILVTGSSGQVGGELLRLLKPLGTIYAPTRDEMDLSQPDSIREVMRRVQPGWVVNAGAYTAVDRAETEKELAFAVNGAAPGVLGEEAVRIGAAVLHYSTDYVYDGEALEPYDEDCPTHPLSVYGASKLEGEQALAASGAAHIILRTSWVYGAKGKNFVTTILRAARERTELTVVDDQVGAPTWSCELARLAATILVQAPDAEAARAFEGIYHAAAKGATSWFGFAQQIVKLQRQAEPETRFAEVMPIPSSSYKTAARRPANSRLNCKKLFETFGFEFPSWQQSLSDVLEEIGKHRDESSVAPV